MKAKQAGITPQRPAVTPAKKRPQEGLLKSIGGTVGKFMGPEAQVIGSAAGDLLGSLFGWGDYEMVPPVNYPVNSNTSVGFSTPLASQIPLMHGAEGAVRVQKREYLRDIKMSSGFNIAALIPLNPLATAFPWLKQIAVNFEQFKWLGLTFGFRSLTANALGSVGNPSMGSVTIVTQYDALDIAPNTKIEANNALFSTSCKPAESMLHPVECDPEQTPSQPLYTGANESFAVSPQYARDPRLTFLGFTSICTQGAPQESEGYLAGELWVTYDIMLYKPYARGPFEEAKAVRKSVLEVSTDRRMMDDEATITPDYETVQHSRPTIVSGRSVPCTPLSR